MLPAKRNKVDISKLSEQDRLVLQKYGQMPRKDLLSRMQRQDRKYFDSGDYALSRAGRAPQTAVGTAIPNPENIPHASSPHQGLSISPTNSISLARESSLSHSESNGNAKDDRDDGPTNDEDQTA